MNARLHLEQALAIYEAEPNPAIFKASALDLPFVIMRFLALVLWPLGSIDRSRRLAAAAVGAAGEKRALSQANALVHKAVFDGLCGGMLQETETILALALAREHTMPLYVAAGSYLTGLAKWRVGDRISYRVIGIIWGGSTPTNALAIRFRTTEPWVPVERCPLPASTLTWSLWTHTWTPTEPGRYEIVLKVTDPAIRTRRLDLFYYVREIEIESI